MPTRNIALTEAQDNFVGELISSGRYQSASEVLRDGLRLLGDAMARREAELADIRNGIAEGLGQERRGELIDGEAAIDEAFRRARDKHGL
jgi:antitoxin ParD1/3/4